MTRLCECSAVNSIIMSPDTCLLNARLCQRCQLKLCALLLRAVSCTHCSLLSAAQRVRGRTEGSAPALAFVFTACWEL